MRQIRNHQEQHTSDMYPEGYEPTRDSDPNAAGQLTDYLRLRADCADKAFMSADPDAAATKEAGKDAAPKYASWDALKRLDIAAKSKWFRP